MLAIGATKVFLYNMKIKEPCRSAFLVVGMHRSGTSAFAGTLGRLGLSVPAGLMAPSPANANGYYESGELAKLHNRVLRSAGSRWDDWSAIEPSWFAEPAAKAYATDIVRFLDGQFARAASFVVKDPRMCRMVPIWRQALESFGAKTHVVIPLRHPDAVAASLVARDGLLAGESYLLWLRHLLDAEQATRDLSRVFVVYDDLLADWRAAVGAMEAQLNYRWPRSPDEAAADIGGFLDPKLRHHRPRHRYAARGDRAAGLAFRGWDVFSRLDQQQAISADSIATLAALRDELDQIPSVRRLPLGIGSATGHVVRLVSRVRSRLAAAERRTLPVPKAGE